MYNVHTYDELNEEGEKILIDTSELTFKRRHLFKLKNGYIEDEA